MIARTESEFNMFNRMDIARREYESLHGVGNGGDGAAERRTEKLSASEAEKLLTPRVKRKKENEPTDSSEPSTKPAINEKSVEEDTHDLYRSICSSHKTSRSFADGSDDEGTGANGEETTTTTITTGDETTPSPLDDLDDEEDLDFSQATPGIHRKMKITRLITDDELPAWLKNDVEEVEKTLENDDDFGKGRRQRKDVDYSDNLTEREFLQALEEGNLDDAVEQKRQRKQSRKSQNTDLDLDDTEARSSFDNPPTPTVGNRASLSASLAASASKRGSVKKRCEAVDPKIAPQCRVLLDRILAHRTEDNRPLAQPFIRLPGQKQLPIYYQTIQEPIDFQRIRRKIDTYRYGNLDEFQADIELLVQNAQTFNCETSLIFADSILLEKVYRNLREQLDAGEIEVSTSTPAPTKVVEEPANANSTATPRTSNRRARATRTSATATPTTTTPGEVSKRGRKRKVAVVKDEEESEGEQAASSDHEQDDGEFQ